jgi:hypothetical protein
MLAITLNSPVCVEVVGIVTDEDFGGCKCVTLDRGSRSSGERCTVRFPQPHHRSEFVKNCGIDSIEVNVVIVQEVDAAKGVTPIRWVLLTNLPVDSFDIA